MHENRNATSTELETTSILPKQFHRIRSGCKPAAQNLRPGYKGYQTLQSTSQHQEVVQRQQSQATGCSDSGCTENLHISDQLHNTQLNREITNIVGGGEYTLTPSVFFSPSAKTTSLR